MDSLRRVYWSEGLFLTPQVFEQQDAYHAGLWKALWRSMGPNFWGIRHLELRDEVLRGGDLDLIALEAVTRGGEVLRYGIESREDNCRIRPRSLGAAFEGGNTTVGVYLAVAAREGHADNIMDAGDLLRGDGHARRFVAGERTASDDFHPASSEPSEVGLADFVVQFLFDTDPGFASARARFDCFRVAQLRKTANGAERLQDFVPPSMMVGAAPPLNSLVRNMFSEVARRATEYEEIKNERSGMRGQESSARDALVKSMLLVLNSASAEFRIVETDLDAAYGRMRCHPEAVYNRLRILVAELSTFSTVVTSQGAVIGEDGAAPLPDYDHENPYPAFAKLSRALNRVLAALVISLEGEIEMVLRERHYTADLPESFFGGTQANYYLAIDAGGLSRDKIVSAVNQLKYKLSSGSMADRIIEVNVPGIDLEQLQIMPMELSLLPSRYTCFKIDKSHRDWPRVESEKVIKLWAPDVDAAASKILIIRSEPE